MSGVPELRSEEVRGVRACLDELCSRTADESTSTGEEPTRTLAALIDGVVNLLQLDFAYVRLDEGVEAAPIEVSRAGEALRAAAGEALRAAGAAQIGRALRRWLPAAAHGTPRVIPNPVGDGEVAIATLALGLHDPVGLLAVGSKRKDFPTPSERLLLQMAVNQAVIRMHEILRLAERRHSAAALEERTTQLMAVNAELRQRLAERERTEQERLKLASLVENSSDFIGLASIDGRLVFVNAAGQRMLAAPEGVQRSHIFDYVADADRGKLEQEILPILMATGRWDGEVRFRHFGAGRDVPMLAHVFLIKEPRSEVPVAMATISKDITQRKREEAELLLVKDELAAELSAMKRLHEFSTQLLTKSDLSSLLTEVLSATLAMQHADFGNVQLYDPVTRHLDIVVQRGCDVGVLQRIAGSEGACCDRALARGGRVIIEDVEADPAFAPRRAIAAAAGFRAMQATPLFASNGEPLGVISTYFRRPHRPSERDLRLTDLYARQAAEMIERERTQAAQRRSEFYLAQGEKISHTGSWVWNIATGEVFWSHEQFRIFGVPPDTKASRELFWSVVHPEDRGVIRQRLEQAMQSRRDFEDHFRVCHADGTIRHVHALAQPVFNASAELIEYVGTVADITERKLAEEGLRRVQHELGRVSRVMTMGELAASIAHEVNQPLAAVAASAGACMRWLSADPPNVAEATAVARSIARDAHRASEVIARIRAHLTGHEPEKSELAVADVIRDATSLVSQEARARGVTVVSPPSAELPRVMGDRIQLQQVVLNLAMNAIEAMRCVVDRRRVLTIVAESTCDGQVCVKVQDTGPGLDLEHRDRIFDAFFSTKAQGMGMGLAISRSIIDSHGGRLWAEANAGGGETFQFTLPAASPASGVVRGPVDRSERAYYPTVAAARGSATNARERYSK